MRANNERHYCSFCDNPSRQAYVSMVLTMGMRGIAYRLNFCHDCWCDELQNRLQEGIDLCRAPIAEQHKIKRA